MSRVYFHSPSEDREVYGTERAWMGVLTDDVGMSPLLNRFSVTKLARFIPPGEFPHRALPLATEFSESVRLWAKNDKSWVVNGEPYSCWEVTLNTCLAVGSDALKLCARLHAQCEIHAFAEGRNRKWLAGIIRQGLASGVMRGVWQPASKDRKPIEPGWKPLAEWLESRDDEPVVTSYSVCDQFPNRDVAGWEDDSDGDGWYDLEPEKRWELEMTAARESCPELKPEGWNEYRFGHGKDAFWLMSQVVPE